MTLLTSINKLLPTVTYFNSEFVIRNSLDNFLLTRENTAPVLCCLQVACASFYQTIKIITRLPLSCSVNH
ncbi:MAG: hypothetical protein LBT09_13415 [Planctomycetaceae bacterium]|nr:hypothetical protein [Planctomycetaceae bacterium]